jgi:dienelactone hydrolase
MNKRIVLILLIISTIIFIMTFYLNNIHKNDYKINGNSFSYNQDRGKVDYKIIFDKENNNIKVYNVSFKSEKFLNVETIYGLLLIPNNNRLDILDNPDKLPAVIYLPGSGGTKEGRFKVASIIASFGYVVLIIDQRGIGETGGNYLSFQDDAKRFENKLEPMQHIMVYDVLKSFDLLREIKAGELSKVSDIFIDKDNIIIVGESMGGRYGIIATALEPRIKGVIGISTAGYNIKANPIIEHNSYSLSIDPDNYLDKISPRKIVMMHSTNDIVIPIEMAKKTFDKAKEQKTFYTTTGCIHGYCFDMQENLKNSLKDIFNK